MSMDQQARALWQRIKVPQKAAFFSCLITGYLVHLYAFTNTIPNSDGLDRVYDTQQMTISGRWFLHFVSVLNDYTQMPAAIGLLSLLFLSLAAVLVTQLLSLKSGVLAGLAGALMAAFPCTGYMFLYMFTASAYSVAIFLAVLSVWLAARRGKGGWLLGVLCLAFSMGIYQAYVTVAISLSLLLVLRETLRPKAQCKKTIAFGVRMAAYLAAGAVLYYAILMIFLKVKDLELLSYLGMDAASSGYPFGQLPRLLVSTYAQVFKFFFCAGADNTFANGFLVAVDILALLAGVYFLVRYVADRKLHRDGWRIAIAIAMLALLPLGMNFGQLLSPFSTPTPLMKYAFVTVYLLVLFAADLCDSRQPGWHAGALAAGTSALLLLFCLNTNNLLYTASAQAHRATESYATRLLSRIESCPGYETGMEVVIIGTVPEEQLSADIPSYAQVSHYSVPENSALLRNKHIYYYLNDWLNFPAEEPDEETMIAVSASEEFADMPLYPAQGSVQVLDGRVVVKLRESYTPKEDYEIAYEQRR